MSRERQILDAAAELFYEHGFYAVKMEDIGARVGVTGPAIYRHFSGKDQLLATLYHEALDELFMRLGGRQEDPREELEVLIRGQAEFALEHRELMGIYVREERALSDPWRTEVARRTRTHMARWVDVLSRCYPDRDEDEINAAAWAAVGLLHSIGNWPRQALATDHLADLLVDLVTDGLASLDAAPVATARRKRRGASL